MKLMKGVAVKGDILASTSELKRYVIVQLK